MSTRCTALIIPAALSDAPRLEVLDIVPSVLENTVGGDIESVSRGDWIVYLNAQGKIRCLAPNLRAAHLMYEEGLDLADVARGTAVFLGRKGRGGESDVPERLVRLAEELFSTRLAA